MLYLEKKKRQQHKMVGRKHKTCLSNFRETTKNMKDVMIKESKREGFHRRLVPCDDN